MVSSLGMGPCIDKVEVQPQGFSGGLLCVWRKVKNISYYIKIKQQLDLAIMRMLKFSHEIHLH